MNENQDAVMPRRLKQIVKPLIILNGRWKRGDEHIYVAAYSKADAARILKEANGGYGSFLSEINVYFSIGCWGVPMAGITPERGAWVTRGNGVPVRVV